MEVMVFIFYSDEISIDVKTGLVTAKMATPWRRAMGPCRRPRRRRALWGDHDWCVCLLHNNQSGLLFYVLVV